MSRNIDFSPNNTLSTKLLIYFGLRPSSTLSPESEIQLIGVAIHTCIVMQTYLHRDEKKLHCDEKKYI